MYSKDLKRISEQVQLVKGEFLPSEALDVISSQFDEKIKFHKTQKLQLWEANHQFDSRELDMRIAELERQKEIAKNFITSYSNPNQKIQINGVIEIIASNS
ncbi:hypothetical protein QVZ41_03840 [Wenyingzhuangia sp. chi5]|uniref:Uncharacterized protein n=1 Tax=Wenyingzhuangia gilva TaxID=3057677 RepID=A0ABT8VPV7_9FLAO|nr:hypothetical protein [Wenyingzhuangia sp. chi5]MDO3693981.1 hypothetical protein [Wenyingzhuangia sp. chi5]